MIGIGIGINRNRYAKGIFNAYSARVVADGGVTEAGGCVDAGATPLLQTASLLLIPSGYKEDVVYSQIPTNGNGDLSFTRASNGTRINSAGLVEDCPWNLIQQSENFSALYIAINSTISNNTTTAPNGTTTADSLIENTATDNHFIFADYTQQSGTQYTYSVYAKSIGGRNIRVSGSLGYSGAVIVDLSNGSVLSGSGVVENVGNGWYRISITATTTTSTVRVIIYAANGTSLSYTGNGTSGVYLWGAQLNIGSISKPYFPTTDRLNVPRLTYQNGGGGCPSLLLEPQRTNLVTFSEQFDNASWAKGNSGTITANSTISPDGTQTADTLNAGADLAQVQQAPIGTSGAVYTVSIWVKRITGTGNVFLRAVENADTLIAVTSDWQRFTATVTSTSTSIRIGVRLATSGDAVAIWGAQIELGAYPTTYIPTTTASATRIADSFSRNNIYTNGLITSSGGTWFVELRNNIGYARDVSSSGLYIDTSNSALTNGFAIRNPSSAAGNQLMITKVVSGVLTPLYSPTTSTAKIAIKWNGTNADIFVNGTKEVSATSFTPTAMEFLNALGSDVPKFIQSMGLYSTPLTDAQCQTLTTL
jgi:hypothetical protein